MPMVTIGIDPTNQATDSIARSPMVLITTLYGLSSRKKFDAMSVLRLLLLRYALLLRYVRRHAIVMRSTAYRYSQSMNRCAVPVFLVPVAMPMSALWSLSAMLVQPAASESFNP